MAKNKKQKKEGEVPAATDQAPVAQETLSPTATDVRKRKTSEKSPEREKSPEARAKFSPRSEKKQKVSKVRIQKEQKRERRHERSRGKKEKKAESAILQLWIQHLRPFCRRHYILVTSSIGIVLVMFAMFVAKDTMEQQERNRLKLPDVTEKVTFEINVHNETRGKVTIGLYGKDCPLTVKNFVKLSTHEGGFGFKGTRFHTLFPGHMMIGGDVTHNDGTGGRSALDEPFERENMRLRHVTPGTVGCVALKDNEQSNMTSQFYITFAPTEKFDGSSVVFGRVLDGMDFVKWIEKIPIDQALKPVKEIVIEAAGYHKE